MQETPRRGLRRKLLQGSSFAPDGNEQSSREVRERGEGIRPLNTRYTKEILPKNKKVTIWLELATNMIDRRYLIYSVRPAGIRCPWRVSYFHQSTKHIPVGYLCTVPSENRYKKGCTSLCALLFRTPTKPRKVG